MGRKRRTMLLASSLILGLGAITLSSLTSCGSNQVQTQKKIQIVSMPTKTTYKVGETLNFEGLVVNVFENGDTKGKPFTEFTTNPSAGYKFAQGDITTDVNMFRVTIIPNDSSIKSIAFELTVVPGETPVVETTPYQFLRSIKDSPYYTIENSAFKGEFIENGNFWTFKNNQEPNYGYAQNSDTIVRYTDMNGKFAEQESYPISSKIPSMYDTSFYEISSENGKPNNCIQRMAEKDFEYYSTLKRRRNTNSYILKASTDPNSDSTYIRDLIQLTTPYQVILNDKNLNVAVGYRVTYEIEMISDNEMNFILRNADETTNYPLKTTIKKVPNLKLPILDDFFKGITDPNMDPAYNTTKSTLINNNFTVYENANKNAIFNEKYGYFGDKDEKNILSLTKDITYEGKTYKKGHYKYTIEGNKVVILEEAILGAETYLPFLNSMELFNNFKDYFLYFGEGAFVFTAMLSPNLAPYGGDAPTLYTFFKDLPITERPLSIDNVEFNVEFSDTTLSKVNTIGCSIKPNRDTPSSKFEIKEFGTSKNDVLEQFFASI